MITATILTLALIADSTSLTVILSSVFVAVLSTATLIWTVLRGRGGDKAKAAEVVMDGFENLSNQLRIEVERFRKQALDDRREWEKREVIYLRTIADHEKREQSLATEIRGLRDEVRMLRQELRTHGITLPEKP